MNNRDKSRDPLPEMFGSEEEAWEFWDTHSTTDNEEYLEPVEMTRLTFELAIIWSNLTRTIL